MAQSIFAPIKDQSFPYRYHGAIEIDTLVGGVPSDKNVAKGWLETKLKGVTSEEQIQRMVAETMVERQVSADEALDIVNKMKNLNGFKRTKEGVLFYEGRQLKAALKEAVSVAVSVEKIKKQGWGSTRKWITGFFPEHVFILEQKLPLFTWAKNSTTGEQIPDIWEPAMEPTEIIQQFVHTRFWASIQYQEAVHHARFEFTVVADYSFTDEEWAMIWTTGEMNGLGASRSQGYGTYKVVKWEKDFPKVTIKELKALSDEVNGNGELKVTTRRTRAKAEAAA